MLKEMSGKSLLVVFILLPVVALTFLIYTAFLSTKSKISKTDFKAFAEYDIAKGGFVIKSLSFSHKGEIPKKYTCDGDNVVPTIRFYNVPKGAKSIVLTVIDPETRYGEFTHWLIWNIDPKTEIIKGGRVPDGAVQGANDYNKNEYDGPCPPVGEKHGYFFNAYALNSKLDISKYSTKKDLENAIKGRIIDTFGITGYYARH